MHHLKEEPSGSRAEPEGGGEKGADCKEGGAGRAGCPGSRYGAPVQYSRSEGAALSGESQTEEDERSTLSFIRGSKKHSKPVMQQR